MAHIEITPNYANMFRMMLQQVRTQSNVRCMFGGIQAEVDRAELLREVQGWFAPLTIAANCATNVAAIEELRGAMTELLAGINTEAARLENNVAEDAADPTNGEGLL